MCLPQKLPEGRCRTGSWEGTSLSCPDSLVLGPRERKGRTPVKKKIVMVPRQKRDPQKVLVFTEFFWRTRSHVRTK